MSAFSTDLTRIREIGQTSRRGEHGAWRKEYDQRYRRELESIFADVCSETRPYFDEQPGGITCRKGCAHCCEHFVSISVAHAILITDYLYTSERALSVFLRGYQRWRQAIESDAQSAALFQRLEQDTSRIAVVKPADQKLLAEYHSLRIPCPFLERGQCAIYPVRPVCCAIYFALSPPDYCRADSHIPATILENKPSNAHLQQLAALADPRLSLHQESLPGLVYKLLTQGYPP